MPKVKPLGTPKKKLTKIEKAEKRAANMLANEEVLRNKEKQRQYDQYVEYKMIKGHSVEDAEKMAKAIIYDQQVV
jgi:type II secretory pathway component HofQ